MSLISDRQIYTTHQQRMHAHTAGNMYARTHINKPYSKNVRDAQIMGLMKLRQKPLKDKIQNLTT